MGTQFIERTWLVWLVKVRIIIITFLLGIELVITRLTPVTVPERTFIVVILLWYTIAVFYAVVLQLWGDYRNQARLQVLSDLLFATAIVHITGGSETYFVFLYPLVIIIASILLTRAWAFLTAALAFIFFGAVLELAYFDVIRSYGGTRPDPKALQAIIFINLFAYMGIAYLSSRLSTKLRQVDVQLQEQSGALESLQALHENIINAMAGGLVTTGLDGRVTLINASGQRLLQRSEHALLGRSVAQLFLDRLPDPEISPALAEVRSVTPEGREKTFAVIASALSVPERGTIGYLYTFDDLTEIRRLEREVRMRDRLAAVGRMAAGIAHEIRNPLSSIAGSAKILTAAQEFNAQERSLLDIINRESERLNAIISDFLAYSREKRYQLADVDLRKLLDDTLTLFENRSVDDGSARGIQIVRQFESATAPAVADGDKMKQVFWNICENAARAMPQGGTLTVRLRAADTNWAISFSDSGPGIHSEDLEKVFEPFQSTFEGGTGLGLALVYQIVQAHQGKVSARSTPGQGAEFTVELAQAPHREKAMAQVKVANA